MPQDVRPPWVEFPGSEPGGWNQGIQEAWKVEVWLPFWSQLSDEEKGAYFDRWPPPHDDWRWYLMNFWK